MGFWQVGRTCLTHLLEHDLSPHFTEPLSLETPPATIHIRKVISEK